MFQSFQLPHKFDTYYWAAIGVPLSLKVKKNEALQPRQFFQVKKFKPQQCIFT
jgi:hypothetical protein